MPIDNLLPQSCSRNYQVLHRGTIAGLIKSIPYTAIAESAFALLHLRKGVDIIPDAIPGKGYADDAAIIAAVLERYKHTLQRALSRRKNTGTGTFSAS